MSTRMLSVNRLSLLLVSLKPILMLKAIFISPCVVGREVTGATVGMLVGSSDGNFDGLTEGLVVDRRVDGDADGTNEGD